MDAYIMEEDNFRKYWTDFKNLFTNSKHTTEQHRVRNFEHQVVNNKRLSIHRKHGALTMPLQIRKKNIPSFIRKNLLTILTVVGVVSGTMLGWGLRQAGHNWTRREVMYFQYPGELFLRMLKCLIVPLLVSSIVSAIGSLDLSLSGK